VTKKYKAIIFDMDGTIVDTQLNFKAMRADLGLPDDANIIDHLNKIANTSESKHAEIVIQKHEAIGAHKAQAIRDIEPFLAFLDQKNIPKCLLTRNSKFGTKESLKKFDWDFVEILTRECAPAKPDPKGLFQIAQSLKIDVSDILFVGDQDFDLETARNAGCDFAYIDYEDSNLSEKADIVFSTFSELKIFF